MIMRPRELFGVGVRLLAVWFWTIAVYYGFLALLKSVGTAPTNSYPVPEDISMMVFNVLVGAFLMRGAPALIWLAYGDGSRDAQDAQATHDVSPNSN
jgi:hypothetical protein